MSKIEEDAKNKFSLSVKSFYGNVLQTPSRDRPNVAKSDYIKRTRLPHRLNNLLGPTQIWKVFCKQSDALEYAKNKSGGLMTFAFQQCDGTRSFLVAHPKIFWHYDIQKDPSQRCTYEIIPESCACKLYFDLEFEVEFNQEKNGGLIVDTFISVVLHYIDVLFNVKASRKDILILDSTTNIKFSRHLIFVLSSLVFYNNVNVGEFVSFICQKIKLYLGLISCSNIPVKNEDGSNKYNECKCCHFAPAFNLGCIQDIGLSRENIQNLVVLDRKGKEQLICDCSVYSRNRHFRLFQNTKWRKNAPLILSEDNLYSPTLMYPKAKITYDLFSEALFLDSLISYTELQLKNVSDNQLIYFNKSILQIEIFHSKSLSQLTNVDTCKSIKPSPYPEIDKFINSLVFPGHVRQSMYFSSSSVIVYDIFGYRYCQNIGRQHRSNNVKYIVNLNDCTYYQKCHDPDCSTFRSIPNTLPYELKVQFEDNSFAEFECSSITDLELVEAANVIEDLLNDQTNC